MVLSTDKEMIPARNAIRACRRFGG